MKGLLVLLVLCGLACNIVCPPVKPDKTQPKEGPGRSDEMNLGLQYEKYLKEVVSVLEDDEAFKKKLEESNVTEIKNKNQGFQRPGRDKPIMINENNPNKVPLGRDQRNFTMEPYKRYINEVIQMLRRDDPSFINKIRPDLGNETSFKHIMEQSGDIAKHLEFVSHGIRSKLDELKRREVDRLVQLRKLLDHKKQLEAAGGNGGPVLGKRQIPGLGRAIPDISGKVVDALLKAQALSRAMS